MLLAVKIGKLGLGLGGFIAPFAFLGALGASLNNVNKWVGAIRTGSAGEKAGAFIALVGDSGTTAVTGALAVKTFYEFRIVVASFNQGVKKLSKAWALGGVRYLNFAARLTPWGLAFTASTVGGEAIYNYFNLDDHQRWLKQCCWGHDDQGWDWKAHAQPLAEATLRPVIVDQGLIEAPLTRERKRTLVMSFPGMNFQSLEAFPIILTAQWQGDNRTGLHDVGEIVRNGLRLSSNHPLTLKLDLPSEWSDSSAVLFIRLSVQPDLAHAPLKCNDIYLHYRIPLDLKTVPASIQGVSGVAHIGEMNGFELTAKNLNE